MNVRSLKHKAIAVAYRQPSGVVVPEPCWCQENHQVQSGMVMDIDAHGIEWRHELEQTQTDI